MVNLRLLHSQLRFQFLLWSACVLRPRRDAVASRLWNRCLGMEDRSSFYNSVRPSTLEFVYSSHHSQTSSVLLSCQSHEPAFKALPINTTSTAANLIIISVSCLKSCVEVAYVAVAAKISILLAELKAASIPANSAVKPAAIPIRP